MDWNLEMWDDQNRTYKRLPIKGNLDGGEVWDYEDLKNATKKR